MANQLVEFLRQSDPAAAAGRTDDEITLHYATAYADKIHDLAQAYPDWKADYDRILDRSIQSQLTAGDYVKNAAGHVVKGAAGVLASIPESAAVAARGIDQAIGTPGGVIQRDQFNSEKPLEDYALHQLGGMIRRAGDAVAPTTQPVLDDSFAATKAPEAVGSALGFAALGGAARAAGAMAGATGAAGEAMQTAAIGLSGAASGGMEQFQDAIAHGADDKTALKAFMLGGVIGSSEIVPLDRMLHRLDGASGGVFSKMILGGIRKRLGKSLEKGVEIGAEAARDAFEESLQEAFQSTAGNEVAADILEYDKDRKLTDGLAEDSGAGAVTGLVMSLLTQAIGRARDGRTRRKPGADGSAADPAATTDVPPQDTEAPPGEPSAPPASPAPPSGDGGESLSKSIGMGLSDEEIQNLAARVATGGMDAEDAAGLIDQEADKTKFFGELARMVALDKARSEAAAPTADAATEDPTAVPGEATPSEPIPAPAAAAPATEPEPEVKRAPEYGDEEKYAALVSKLDALAASGAVPEDLRAQIAEAIDDHQKWERSGGAIGSNRSVIIDELTATPAPRPAAEPPAAPAPAEVPTEAAVATPEPATPPGDVPPENPAITPPVEPAAPIPTPVVEVAPTPPAPPAPTAVPTIPEAPKVPIAIPERVDAVTPPKAPAPATATPKHHATLVAEAFSGSNDDQAENAAAPQRIDGEIAAAERRIKEITKLGGEYFQQMERMRPGDPSETPAMREVNRLMKRIEKLKQLKDRAIQTNSRDLLLDPNSVFLEATGLESNDSTKTGREAAGYFELTDRDNSGDAQTAKALFQEWAAADTAGKPAAAAKLASQLFAQGLPPGGSRALSRRVGIFKMRDGTYLATLLKDTGGKNGVKPIEGKNADGSPKYGDSIKTSVVKPKTGKAGKPGFYSLTELMAEGAVPVASVRLAAARSKFVHSYSATEFASLSSALRTAQSSISSMVPSTADAAAGTATNSEEGEDSAPTGSDIPVRSGASAGGVVRGLDDEARPSGGVASSAVSTEHAETIFETMGGGEATLEDSIAILADGLSDEEFYPAYRSLAMAAEAKLQSNAEHNALSPEEQVNAVNELAAQWIADASRGGPEKSEFAARLVQTAGLGAGVRQAIGRKTEAGQGGGGDSAVVDPAAARAALKKDVSFLLECGVGEEEIAVMSPEEVRSAAAIFRKHLESSEEQGRHRRVSPNAMPNEVSFVTGIVKAARVLAHSVSGAIANLNRAEPSPVLVEANRLVGPLKNALQIIADSKVNPAMSALASSLAAMAPDAQVKLGHLSGSYGHWSGSDVTLNPGPHIDVPDLYRTVLEEAVHSVTSGWADAQLYRPETLSPAQIRLLEQVKSLMAEARQAGMTWQDMNDPLRSLDEFIAKVKLAPTKVAPNILQRFTAWLRELFQFLVGSGGRSNREIMADAQALADAMIGLGPAVRPGPGLSRKVDGYLGAATFESTADDQFNPVPDGKIAAAVANFAQSTYEEMLAAYKAASSLPAGLSVDDFINFIHETARRANRDAPQEVTAAIDAELLRQGFPGSVAGTTIDDLNASSGRLIAAREAVIALQGVQGALNARFGEVSEAFADEVTELANVRNNLMLTTRDYASLDHTQGLLLRDMRRALRETADRGAASILKALGITDPKARKAAVDAAAAKVQANPAAFTDAIDALSAAGIDFAGVQSGSVPLSDVVSAVKSSADPRLAPLVADSAMFALAVNFGKRHSLLMDLLPARTAPTERRALDTMIALATSSRPDAHDLAVAQLAQLKRLGGRGARILEQLRSLKEQFKARQARVDAYTRILDAYPEVSPVLNSAIGKLQDMLKAEVPTVGDTSRQWEAAQGAVYFVPENDNTKPDDLFAGGEDNTHRRVLQLGEKFDFSAVRDEVAKIRSWLEANPNFVGARRAFLERVISEDAGLLAVSTTNAIRNIRQGPASLAVRFFGDIGSRLVAIGTHGARENSRLLRKFVTGIESIGRGRELAEGTKADELKKRAMDATGIEHPEDFMRRFYSDAFAYLGTRTDLAQIHGAAGTPAARALSERAALDAILTFFKSRPDDKALFERNPKAWPAIREFIKQSADNNGMVQGWIGHLGLKVRDKVLGMFRAPIGSPYWTMSRLVSRGIRTTVRTMAEAWTKPIDWSTVTDAATASTALSGRFTQEVWSKFVLPMAHKTGQSLFYAPEIGGVRDLVRRADLIAAATAAKGDFVQFAMNLYLSHGGAPGGEVEYIKSTFETVDRYFRQLLKVSEVRDQKAEGDEIGRTFLDAREGDDYPADWLEFRSYGTTDITRYARVIAAQAAFGNGGADFKANMRSAEYELSKLAEQFTAYAKMPPGPAKEAEKLRLQKTGNWTALKSAPGNLEELKRISHDFDTLWSEYRADPTEFRLFTRMLGTISGALVQGVGTTMVDNVTLLEAPVRKFGVGSIARGMIAGNLKGYAGEFMGSLFQALGKELSLGAQWAQDTIDINDSGLADPDASLNGYRARYKAGIASLPSVREAMRREGIPGVTTNIAKRVTEGVNSLLSTGIGKASKDGGYATFKPLAPFTMGGQLQHRAAARGWLQVTRRIIEQAASHMRANPVDAANPKFQLTYEAMGGDRFFGLFGAPNRRSWEYIKSMLEQSGISIEDAARYAAQGMPPLTQQQRHAIIALAQSEITLNTSAVTRPTGTSGVRGLIAHPVVSPLLGWSIAKMADVAKTSRDPHGVATMRAAGSALAAFALGVLPASLAFAWLRDEYDEKLVGKKPNVQGFGKGNAVQAAVDAMARVGTFGLAGDALNSAVNFDTAREFSVDSRVLAVNMLLSLTKAMGTLVRQRGDVDYAGFYRPLMGALGGSGYLANFDVINNLAGMDNQEARIVRRINVSNLVRASAKEVGVESRSGRAIASAPSPMKPYVGQMLLAAYANDHTAFKEAYTRAVQVLKDDEVPTEEARKRVASSFSSQNPVTLALSRKPTEREWRSMLSTMDSNQRAAVEVSLRNFAHYAESIGAPAVTFTAKDTSGRITMPRTSGDWRALTVSR